MEISKDAIDPAASLELIEKSASKVAIDDFLDFGPAWYAPLIAAGPGGFALADAVAKEPSASNSYVIFLVLALAAVVAVCMHDYDRRLVRPRETRQWWLYNFLPSLAIFFIVWEIWSWAISAIGYEDFMPTYAIIAWLLTSGFYLGVRAVFHSVRYRRRATA